MRKNNRTGKRLRLIPLILGSYGAFLGLGLVVIGLAEIEEGIGIIRLLMGLGMAGFGVLGIWDGVRDLVMPDKRQKQAPARQFILTDISGNRSSNVTVEALQKQLESLMESDKGGVFKLQILPPYAVQETGNISQVFCIYHAVFGLTVFLEESKGGYESYHKSAAFDETKTWFEELLTGNADLSEWNKTENASFGDEYEAEGGSCEEEDTRWEEDSICIGETEDTGWEKGSTCLTETEDSLEDKDDTTAPVTHFNIPDALMNTEKAMAGKNETDTRQTEEHIESFWHQLQREQKGQMRGWYQLLVIFGESWHDEHKFFSARDMELAIEGIHEGKYIKVALEWGMQGFDFFPGVHNDLMVVWCTNNTGNGDTRFLVKEGTVTQVKFWMANYMNHGGFEEMGGWADITDQIQKANRKDKKKHGK